MVFDDYIHISSSRKMETIYYSPCQQNFYTIKIMQVCLFQQLNLTAIDTLECKD